MDERRFLIRCIVGFYATAVAGFGSDLAVCESRRSGQCDNTRARLEGALSAAPAALMAILVKSSPAP